MAKKKEPPKSFDGLLDSVRVKGHKLVMRLEHEEGGKLTQTDIVFALQGEGILDEIVEAVEELRLQFAEEEGEQGEEAL
jgi:hypothetical protein